MTDENKHWLTSKETKKKLKITGCELMHRRECGSLEFKKVGNSYFYKISTEHKKKDS